MLLLLFILLPCYSAFATTSPATVTTFAGGGEWGSEDGVGQEATFRLPSYAAVDHEGMIYVSDTQNHLIRKIDKDGKVTTVAGITKERDESGLPIGGLKDGSPDEAMFNEPRGLAIASDGRIYVADSQNGAIREIERSGKVSTVIENLDFPSDIVLDKNGDLIVTETLKHRVLKISQDGHLTVIAGGGYAENDGFLVGGLKDGTGVNAQFNEPTGLAISPNGTVYVADTGNQRIRALPPSGNVTTIAGSGTEKIAETGYLVGGYEDGPANKAKFNYPQGLALAADGTLYIADTLNHRIRKMTPNGEVETVAGSEDYGRQNGIELEASFDNPLGVIVLSDSNLLIVDRWNHALRLLTWYELPRNFKQSDGVQVILGENVLSFDVQPEVVSGRVMLPIRTLAEELGFNVFWNEQTRTVTFTEDEQNIHLQIGSKVVTGEEALEMDVAPYTKDGRTFVPIRFVAEAFQKDVKWIGSEKVVLIRE